MPPQQPHAEARTNVRAAFASRVPLAKRAWWRFPGAVGIVSAPGFARFRPRAPVDASRSAAEKASEPAVSARAAPAAPASLRSLDARETATVGVDSWERALPQPVEPSRSAVAKISEPAVSGNREVVVTPVSPRSPDAWETVGARKASQGPSRQAPASTPRSVGAKASAPAVSASRAVAATPVSLRPPDARETVGARWGSEGPSR